jgi:hypothetical protein
MNARQYFILGLRLLGVWQLIDAIDFFFTTMSVSAQLYRPTISSLGFYILATFVHFSLAVWLLKFAPATARFFYPERRSSEDDDNQPPSTPTI